ncbi:MAG TPA: ABC transporter permease [Stellaceae bacterium]|jgi:NitT/TauT family transport system permease protein|nr:ABC transporter permease [Stellaceae bacterium]
MTVEIPATSRLLVPRTRRLAPFAPIGLPSLGGLRPVILPIATAALVLALWQGVVFAFRVPHVILPPPSDIAVELWRMLPALLQNALPTTADSLMAFFAATLLGIGIAIVLTYSPVLRDTLYPNLILFQLIPKVALAPLFVVWLGISSQSRVTFATFISFFPIVISAVVGFASAEKSALRLCRSLTASEWQSFVMVRFPFALPAIFSGMKVAMTMAIIGVIIGEFISAKAGLGYYILYASSRMETALIFAALFVLCVIGVALFGAVALAEQLVRRVYGRQ